MSLGQCEAIPLLLRVGSGTETTVKHRQGRVKILGGKNILFKIFELIFEFNFWVSLEDNTQISEIRPKCSVVPIFRLLHSVNCRR